MQMSKCLTHGPLLSPKVLIQTSAIEQSATVPKLAKHAKEDLISNEKIAQNSKTNFKKYLVRSKDDL